MKKKIILVSVLLIFASALYFSLWFKKLSLCQKNLSHLISDSCLNQITILEPLLFLSPSLQSAYRQIKPFLPYRDYLLGLNSNTSYMIMLQNDYELRTNGGFPGSFAVITLKQGQPSFRFEDIYTPDGQINGYIKPPPPIQTAFQIGEYRLRDADWSADFPKTARTLRWFMEKGGEIHPNLIATINFTTLKKIVTVLGELEVPEYNLKVDPDNLYLFLQNQAEVDFFPGSTQKKDALTAVGRALINQITRLPYSKQIEIINLILTQLNHQNILINSDHESLQSVFESKNWAGVLKPTICASPNCLSDTYAAIETNLGANKANCCVKRQTSHNVYVKNNLLIHQVNLIFDNNSPSENPIKPYFYGGNYIFYLRFYLPQSAQNIIVKAKPTLPQTLISYPKPLIDSTKETLDIADVYDLKEIGFFHLTKAQTASEISLEYRLPVNKNESYQLSLLKQSGVENSPQSINFFGETINISLENDYLSPQTTLH